MAQIIRCTFRLGSLKLDKSPDIRKFVPWKYPRSWIHTSYIMNVKGKEVLMPSLSPTMETGTIVKWIKRVGDPIQAGDALADIQTDKAVMTFEMDDDSVLAKIIVPEGTKDVKVGTLIALTVEPDEDWTTVEMPTGTDVASPSSSTPAQSSASAEPQEIPAGQISVMMPALSPTMTTGTIVKWLKKEGDDISPGDALADIQTDKAVMTFEMDEEATLAKILVSEGSQVEVGQLIAITVEKGTDWKNVVVPTNVLKSTPSPAAPSSASASPTSQTPVAAGPKPPASGQVYGLAVKRLLEEYGLSSGSVKGTGRPNRLLKGDVLAHIQANNIQKVTLKADGPPSSKSGSSPTQVRGPILIRKNAPSTYKDLEINNIRAVIAKRLTESKSNIPHAYATMNINIDKLSEIRNKMKAEGVSVSVNDFITKAVSHALLECPDINCLYKDGQVIRMQNVDVSVAVSTPTGLITPIVFDSSRKSLTEISSSVRELAGKARDGTLKPNEFQGGTFTISNLGMFGIKEFSAIINPPQTAILAVGAGRNELDSSLRKVTRLTVTLSYDRRAINEDQAADFLAVLRAMLEDPTFLAVGRAQALRYARE
ncbi:dihydrolipoyllysine-residue acetyltransferase component of pyruvate dehydrogenase complex-like [Venturia canescens]|uniref:dihydrolipoyllysine-residue acetyltransferase component of pyruvate dehydrogenase complex-like n=1 Tax=Venturia canescens TaxID=32260 RepID=UPI001C9C6B14|nr:dihydrolipoyllysine-residue acetyltransferase component of pyruvate dehydrogenase complex-like [Venturia canescens]